MIKINIVDVKSWTLSNMHSCFQIQTDIFYLLSDELEFPPPHNHLANPKYSMLVLILSHFLCFQKRSTKRSSKRPSKRSSRGGVEDLLTRDGVTGSGVGCGTSCCTLDAINGALDANNGVLVGGCWSRVVVG